jgi:hypothetical protein
MDAEVERLIERFEGAAREFSRGDPAGVKALYSHAADVTLANPFGPAVKGWSEVSAALDFASSRFSDGDVEDFRTVAAYESSDLVTVLGTERWKAKIGGARMSKDSTCASRQRFAAKTEPGRSSIGMLIRSPPQTHGGRSARAECRVGGARSPFVLVLLARMAPVVSQPSEHRILLCRQRNSGRPSIT